MSDIDNFGPRVTFYFAVKLANPGMAGYLNHAGAVGRNNHARSTDRAVIEAIAAEAVRKYPDWTVEVRSSTAPACLFD